MDSFIFFGTSNPFRSTRVYIVLQNEHNMVRCDHCTGLSTRYPEKSNPLNRPGNYTHPRSEYLLATYDCLFRRSTYFPKKNRRFSGTGDPLLSKSGSFPSGRCCLIWQNNYFLVRSDPYFMKCNRFFCSSTSFLLNLKCCSKTRGPCDRSDDDLDV